MKWTNFPRYWPFVRGIHRSPVNSPHKCQWRGALMFPLICTWIHSWANNREAGDLRHDRAHYDVTVMILWQCEQNRCTAQRGSKSSRHVVSSIATRHPLMPWFNDMSILSFVKSQLAITAPCGTAICCGNGFTLVWRQAIFWTNEPYLKYVLSRVFFFYYTNCKLHQNTLVKWLRDIYDSSLARWVGSDGRSFDRLTGFYYPLGCWRKPQAWPLNSSCYWWRWRQRTKR